MKTFKITKVGLINFWYFDNEEFNFSDGKILLRGENGSGKSVTMQSFIPLILDGNKLPSRLDPFGSKEKKIEDYILGPSDGEQKEEAISYLYMETYNEDRDKYITIGMGFKGRRGRPTDFWGFALLDNKRIGIDFFLYKDYGGKVLLSKNELRARLSSDSRFVDSQKEYKSMVNDLLFGFENTDSYDEFINVLLQLRSSKLSKEYTPTKLMDTLTRVLQPLTVDDLRPLSDAIEDTNKTKEQIETLNKQIKSLTNFLKTYQNYNEIILYNKALDVYNSETSLTSLKKEIKSKNETLENLKKELASDSEKYVELELENDKVIARIEAIGEDDLERHTKNLEELNDQIIELQSGLKTEEEILKKRNDKRINLENLIKKYDNEIYQKERDNRLIIDSVMDISDDIKLNDVSVELNKIAKSEEVNFVYLIDRVRKYKAKLVEIKGKLEEIEQLEKNLDIKQQEYEKIKRNYQKLEEDLNKFRQSLSNLIIEFKDSINNLNTTNQMIILDEQCRIMIFDLLDNYCSGNYIKARDIYNKVSYEFETENIKEKTKLQQYIKTEEDNLSELNKELEDLNQKQELDYVMNLEDMSTLNTLNDLQIPYIPLYKAIEFKDDITIEEQNHIEELLDNMHILNALIIPPYYLDKISKLKGVYLKKSNKKEKNLLKYFNICSSDLIKYDDIKEILESISIDNTNSSYINNNSYQLDFIIGYPGNIYQSKYIGLLKRKKELNKKIEEIKEQIKEKISLINNYKNLIASINNKLELIKLERTYFPSSDELDQVLLNISECKIEMNNCTLEENNLSMIIMNITKEIEEKLSFINTLKNNISLPFNLGSYNNAISNCEALLSSLYELKSGYESYLNLFDLKKVKELELEDNENEISDARDNISFKNIQLNKVNSKRDIILEILNDPTNKDKIEELKLLRKRLNEIPKERELISLKKGKMEERCEAISNELENILENIKKIELVLDLKKLLLEKEYNLGYVYSDNLDVNKIIKELSNHRNDDVIRAQGNYFAALNDYRNDLLDYRLNNKEIFSENDTYISDFITKGLNREEIEYILNQGIRFDVSAIYQGKVVNVFELCDCIKQTIAESEAYITTQERHLFEDILLKTVGRKIRDRINESRNWVLKMNNIMKETQSNSNLSFQLEWKSKNAYTEDELDTKELVRLFQIDSGAIDSKDSDKLINHFRSKIKKELENDAYQDNYTNVIFNVLDYRNWFEFKIYYKRKFSERKELTNKIHAVFSGGERAKSMYIPLFAAVYSKLESARSDALRIVALDEAFAGVDEGNITELFDILGRLNLDYILTSQGLWGDYSTVQDLSIAELIKDESIKAVAIQRYHWNGKIKEIIESDINE